jgi:transposase
MATLPCFYAGVDTHRDTHTGAVVDQIGRVVDTSTFDATETGYDQLIGWVSTYHPLIAVGVEGTGSYGAGLTRQLSDAGIDVREIIRPNRQHRRRNGKSDTTDAISAAKQVASGEATNPPRGRTGNVETIRVLRNAHKSAVREQTRLTNQIKAAIITCPNQLRTHLENLTTKTLIKTAEQFPPPDPTDPTTIIPAVLGSYARRWRQLENETKQLATQLEHIITQTAP